MTVFRRNGKWVAEIATGDYTNDSEYIRALIRRDQEQSLLKQAIDDGIASGVSPRSLKDIWSAAERRAAAAAKATRSMRARHA